MFMVEITEDKFEGLVENIGKGLKYLNKSMECLAEMKSKMMSNERYEDDEDDDDMEMNERYGNRRGGGRSSMRRGSGGGRYSRY